MVEIKIRTEFIKLDQFLKWAGITDMGSLAKEIVLSGDVKVNGKKEFQRGKKLYTGDIVEVTGVVEKFKVIFEKEE